MLTIKACFYHYYIINNFLHYKTRDGKKYSRFQNKVQGKISEKKK